MDDPCTELSVRFLDVDLMSDSPITLRVALCTPMECATLEIGTIDVQRRSAEGLTQLHPGWYYAFFDPRHILDDCVADGRRRRCRRLVSSLVTGSSASNAFFLTPTQRKRASKSIRDVAKEVESSRREGTCAAGYTAKDKWHPLTLNEAAQQGRRCSRLLGRGVHVELAVGAARDAFDSDAADSNSPSPSPSDSPTQSSPKTTKGKKGVIAAYYRLRSVAKMIQNNMGWVASGVERFKNFLLWTQPRKTQRLLYLCVFLFFLFLVVPSRYILLFELWREFIEPMFEPGTLIRRSKFFLAQTPNDEHFRKMFGKGGAIHDLLSSEQQQGPSMIPRPIPMRLLAQGVQWMLAAAAVTHLQHLLGTASLPC